MFAWKKSQRAKRDVLFTFLSAALLMLVLFGTLKSVCASEIAEVGLSNLSGDTVAISYEELRSMPKTLVSADLFCYGVRLNGGEWGGVSLELLLNKVGIDSQALSVEFTAGDGYSVLIPLERAVQSDVILAYEKDNFPLSETLRLVVPEANGRIWIAMVTSISLNSGPSQIEGQYVSAGVTPLQGLPSSLFEDIRNTTQTENLHKEPVDPLDTGANKTVESKSSPSGIEEKQLEEKPTREMQSESLQAKQGYTVVIALLSGLSAVAACLLLRRRNLAVK